MNLAFCFAKTDKYLGYLETTQQTTADPDIKNMCAGMAALSAATVYEIAIKDIFIEFALTKHKVLHNFTSSYFEKISGKVQLRDIRDQYVIRFGEKYLKRFDTKLEKKETELLKLKMGSIKSSYGNLLTWRNLFVHQQSITATFAEVKGAYLLGKNVIECLRDSMRR